MNHKNYSLAKILVLAAGLIGCILYVILLTAGLDAKGLPMTSHWSHTALWALTGLAALIIFLTVRSIPDSADSSKVLPASIRSGIGCLAAGAGFFAFGAPSAQFGMVATADMVLRGISGAALCAVAFCRFTGRKSLFLLHATPCLYLAFRMINQYRLWSADPQIVEYCFYLGSYVALLLTCYQLAAFDAGLGSHKKLWACGLAAVFLCGVSLAGPQEQPLILCWLIWVTTNLRFPKESSKEE